MRLGEIYRKEVVPALREEFGYKSVMEVPRLSKVVLNMGVGEAAGNKDAIENAVKDLALIAGQKPLVTHVRKSVAGFKIRNGWPIGCKVTLRRARMYEFLERLVNVAIPRIRDFRGISPRSFDRRGNFAMGIAEQIVFPEIDYDKTDKLRGLDVVVVTTANSDKEAHALLKRLNFPFREPVRQKEENTKDG